MLINRDEIELNNDVLIPPGASKTLCRDTETCETLNHFLDTGYGVPPTLGFSIHSTDEHVSATINLNGFGVREKAEVIGRLVHFVMNELNKVKNVQ
jgi:hypothetical protein